jgi:hypothetical protein
MKLMCVKSASKIAPILHMLPMFCALPFGAGQPLAPSCPGFNPNPFSKLAPKDCPDHNVFRCARAHHTLLTHRALLTRSAAAESRLETCLGPRGLPGGKLPPI